HHLRADRHDERARQDDVRPDPPAPALSEAGELRERVRRRPTRVEESDPQEALGIPQRREHGQLPEEREERGLPRIAGREPEEEDDDDQWLEGLALRAAERDEREETRTDEERAGVLDIAVLHLERLDEEVEEGFRSVARRPGHDARRSRECLRDR